MMKLILLAAALVGFASCASKDDGMQTMQTQTYDYGTSTSSK